MLDLATVRTTVRREGGVAQRPKKRKSGGWSGNSREKRETAERSTRDRKDGGVGWQAEFQERGAKRCVHKEFFVREGFPHTLRNAQGRCFNDD